MDKKEAMRAIRDQVITVGGELMAERVRNGTFPVLGEGSHEARILFVGEAPGKNEAETGRPFCGAAGRVLDELIASLGLKREDVYITNVVKDRPPNNRDPAPDEIASCSPYLMEQLAAIQPEVIELYDDLPTMSSCLSGWNQRSIPLSSRMRLLW